jgi:hypothetical protein
MQATAPAKGVSPASPRPRKDAARGGSRATEDAALTRTAPEDSHRDSSMLTAPRPKLPRIHRDRSRAASNRVNRASTRSGRRSSHSHNVLTDHLSRRPPIPHDVRREPRLPERRAGGWGRRIPAPPMPMPEAPVDENHGAAARKDEIRRAGKVADIEPEPVAEPVQNRLEGEIRRRVCPHECSASALIARSWKGCPRGLRPIPNRTTSSHQHAYPWTMTLPRPKMPG